MPSKKKKYNTRFPPARIKKIMQTNEEVGKVAAAVPVIISRALELFLESLVKSASNITTGRNAKTLTTSHVKYCVLGTENFHFLKSLVDSYPDIQTEDEFPNCPYDNQSTSSLSQVTIPRTHRRANTAGPSHSTPADESETCSADDDDDEGSADSCCELAMPNREVCSVTASSSSFLPPSSTQNTMYMPGTVQGFPPRQEHFKSPLISDEDYDL